MAEQDELKSIVQRMIDAGESEDNIATVIQHFQSPPKAPVPSSLPPTVERMGPQPVVHHDDKGSYITDDPNDVTGLGHEVMQNMQQSALDPTVGLLADFKIPGAVAKAVSQVRLPFKIGMPSMQPVKNAVGGAAKFAGDVLDSDLVGVVSPRAQHAGAMIRRAGEYLTKETPNAGGKLVGRSVDPMAAMLDEARTLPRDIELPASNELPPTPTQTIGGRPSVSGAPVTNPHMQQPGRSIGVPESAYAPKPLPPPPNPNAGGSLVPGAPRPSVESQLADVVREANVPARPPVDMTPPVPDVLSRAGRSLSGEEIEALRPKRSGAAVVEDAAPAVDAEVAKSEIQRQLEASLEQAGLKKAEGVAKSKSSGFQGSGSEPSATPGLTRNDVEALGLNPDEPISHLTQAMIDNLLQARQSRHGSYVAQAREANLLLDKLAKDK